MPIEIRDERRIATPSIRGYYYQFLWTALCWIELAPGEALYCEGSEDIDKVLPDGEVQLEQIKHLSGNLTETSEDIKSVLLNFAKDYVFNLRRGVRAKMAFRTTARLGNATKDPLLDKWLEGGPVDTDKLAKKITEFAALKNDRKGRAVVRYLRHYGLLSHFASSFEWRWGECEYQEIRVRLADHLRMDARCEGLRPEALADAMIARIARISSSAREKLGERRLDSLDFELLINDHLLSKQVQRFGEGAPPSGLLHVALRELRDVAAVVVGRFGSEEQVCQLFAGLREHLENHPEGIPSGGMLDSREGRTMMSQVDVDLYATFGIVPEVRRRAVRYRWLARRAIKQATARGAITEITVEEPWQLDEIRTWLAKNYPHLSSSVRTPEDPVAMYVARVAEALVRRGDTPEAQEWAQINRMISRKVRFILNWDTPKIFTQENPLR